MSEQLRNLHPPEEVMLIGRTMVIRKILEEAGISLGAPPFSSDIVDRAWEHIVVYPVDPDALDWVIGSFGGLLIEHFRARFGFELKELTDAHGPSICLVEARTNVQLFPFDTIQRRIIEQRQRPFGELFAHIDNVMAQQGLAPHRSPA